MAEPYLGQLKSIVGRLSPSSAATNITCRHFFSGAAAYIDGHIFMSLTPVGLALKLPQDDRDALLGQGAKPLQYFPKAPVKKDYVVLPGQLMDEDVVGDWILRSIDFVQN